MKLTINLLRLLIILLFLVGCASVEIADFEACAVELPYSKDGYCKRVVSQKSRRVKKEVWVKERRTMICLPSDSYAMLKKSLYKMCFNNKCKQALDSVGDIFQQMDDAVKAVYGVVKQ